MAAQPTLRQILAEDVESSCATRRVSTAEPSSRAEVDEESCPASERVFGQHDGTFDVHLAELVPRRRSARRETSAMHDAGIRRETLDRFAIGEI